MAISRRTVLRYGLLGAGVLAVGGAGLALRGSRPRTPKGPLLALDAQQFAVLAAVADRIVPGGGAFPSAEQVGVAERVDALLATMDPAAVDEVKQILGLVESALPMVFAWTTATFTTCEPETQDAILTAWRTSPVGLLRTAFKAVRGLCASCCFTSPDTWAAVGYPGPPDLRVAEPEPLGETE